MTARASPLASSGPRLAGDGARRAGAQRTDARNGPRMIGGDMDKPSNERGSTGPTDGIKAEGDAGNERHICKANPAMIDDIGKKHGLEDTSENFSGEKYALAPKAATKFLKASRCYVILGKTRRVLWWLGLLLLSPAVMTWAERDNYSLVCSVLTLSPPPCSDLNTYGSRLTAVLGLGFLCWVMIPVVSCVKSVIRSLYPNVPDLDTPMASHVVIGIVSFFMLCVSLPLLFLGIITMHI